ncbi:MAG TPA: proton-conducting transporter membrane subunit [Caulobacteraceae bacterium]|nr:proton-conducting transporter membrane subunit [Caulobacteraceae bacterium]
MTPVASLAPLTVAGPLAVAAAMLALAHALPRYVPDVIAILTALGVAAICAVLARHALEHGALVYWFGGWRPLGGVVLGIGFGVDPASAAIASFIGLLFAASLVFAWGYFDEVHAHFHVLMLLFLAAMVGFCLTRDLFDLFVWFEVMSVAAFALTAYQLEAPSLAGALNFTVTNSLASFMMLGGVGLVYARAGVLDFQAHGQAVARAGHDPVIAGAFCLLAAALMIKGATAPFHFWLSDAHAVAPSPVSVIFSGAMVASALFVLAKLGLQVFAGSADARALMRGLFVGLGAVSAVAGGLMAWRQRHLKRMLAFSTIAHLGVMLMGLASLTATGVAGLVVYFVGHGLVKGALFMLAGVLLATGQSIDELRLRGRGRGQWATGLAMALAGILLGGAPWGVLDTGTDLVHAAAGGLARPWIAAAIVLGAGLTGAAVLRACGRIFLGLGPQAGEEAHSPTDEETERADRPLWLMLAPCLLLLALALLPAEAARGLVARAVAMLADPSAIPARVPALGRTSAALGWASTALSLSIAAFALWRERLPRLLTGVADRATRPLFGVLKTPHSGLVGDYVAWIGVGLAAFSIALALR